MYRNLILALATASLLLTSACSGKSAVKPAPTTSAAGASTGASATGDGAVANAGTVGDTGGSGASAPAGVARLIYFDFDSAEIRPEFVSVIAAHARAIAANASIHVRLEGHTDERGSPEYNIGLGERRAQAVRRALMLQGVGEGQLSTVSYGEERPVATGQTEADWAKNRRVEFVYLN
ncbi:MAG: peptidoglycan-associated lipoprotein Pal [Proteobacteria bacterium]|nr:peptidoglycan-associated lipoprotein Pal [Pseudomonadota bacterium]